MSAHVTFIWEEGPPLLPAERRRLLELLFGAQPDAVSSPLTTEKEGGPEAQAPRGRKIQAVREHPWVGTVSED